MKQKDILFIGILTTIVTIAWIVLTILHNINTSTINETLGIQILPITGSFDKATIESLSTRRVITPDYSFHIISDGGTASPAAQESLPIPSPEITTTPTPTDEKQIIPTPTESEIPISPTSDQTEQILIP